MRIRSELNKVSLGVLFVCLLGCAPENTTSPTIDEQVQISNGLIRGAVGADGLKQYQGIPYAAAPIGSLRWAPPAPAASWPGVRDATSIGPACPQPVPAEGSFYGGTELQTDEDCLFLNVWTRAEQEDANLPVMVWIHGGALVTGSGGEYPGALLTSKGVVLVTINYRLGRFGFHAHPDLSAESAQGASGNQGLRDQIAALHWVRENIEKFGGNPENVTIFGESAGSLSVSLLQASPLAKGLFHRVIGQSGGAFQPMWYRDRTTTYAESAEQTGQKFVQALIPDNEAPSLTALRELPAEHILNVFESDPAFSNYDALAIVDGDVIPDEVATLFKAGKQADVPVLIGSNANEGTTFLPYFTPVFGEGSSGFQAYAAATLKEVNDEIGTLYPYDDPEESWINLFSDVLFTYPMRTWAQSMDSVSSEAYLYWFTWSPPIENSEHFRAFHAGEIGYVFGNVDLFGAVPTAEDHMFSDYMARVWTQFAKTGNPNGKDLALWPAYDSELETYMELGLETGQKTQLRLGQMDLIRRAWQIRRDLSTTTVN